MSSTLQLPGVPVPTSASPPPLKIGFVSLGCPKNLVDSEVMMGYLEQAGAELTADTASADVLVVNTCSFIDSAKQESVDTILELAGHKVAAGGRVQTLIVAGCLVERYRDEIRRNLPEVDAVVGTGELEAILAAAGLARPEPATPSLVHITGFSGQAIVHRAAESTFSAPSAHSSPHPPPTSTSHEVGASRAGGLAVTPSRPEGDLREQQGRFTRAAWDGATAVLPSYLYSDETPRRIATGTTSAYIKIAEGCDHPCTFCVIPNLRGKFRSRRLESVVLEAERLVASGVREITLIGQDTTCYGEDLGLRDGLALLLDRLARIDGLTWLRFLYTYPNRITTRLLETMARHANICPYLDVPLQHAAPSVLKQMRRGGGPEIFLRTIEKARSIVPDLVLRTGFIVGFPGETEEDFATLKQFVRDARFDWLGVFSYSDEEGAKAFDYAEKIPRRTTEARRRSLMKLQQGISKAAKARWVNRELDVLVQGPSEETPLLWEGRSALHAPEIDGKLYINDFGEREMLAPGTFYRCQITETHGYDVVARVL